MKNSTLVMMCSLAGACAVSAHAQLYSLTTYKVFTTPDTAALKVGAVISRLAGDLEAHDPYFGSNIGKILGAWGGTFNPPSPSPTWYYVQMFYADSTEIYNGSTLQFSNSYGAPIVPALTSATSQYSLWSAPVQNSASMFTTTYQSVVSNETWFAFITASNSSETGGANTFALYNAQNGLMASGTADLSSATDTTAAVYTTTPAPGAVALLGLAGAFGARRRRN